MMDENTYKKEVVRMWDSIRDDEYKGTETCSGVTYCDECPLNNVRCGESFNAFEMIEAVEKWSREHQQKEHIDIVRKMPNERPQKKHKISQLEYDILKYNYYINATSRFFFDDKFLMSLLKEGYFKGADEKDVVNCYFLNCEVDNDYKKR